MALTRKQAQAYADAAAEAIRLAMNGVVYLAETPARFNDMKNSIENEVKTKDQQDRIRYLKQMSKHGKEPYKSAAIQELKKLGY